MDLWEEKQPIIIREINKAKSITTGAILALVIIGYVRAALLRLILPPSSLHQGNNTTEVTFPL